LVQRAASDPAQADGAVKRVLADLAVVALAAALAVHGSDQVDLVEFVSGPRLRSRPLWAWPPRGAAHPRRRPAVALGHARAGAGLGPGTPSAGLEFSPQGGGAAATVARRR